jgi:hypothetical protein
MERPWLLLATIGCVLLMLAVGGWALVSWISPTKNDAPAGPTLTDKQARDLALGRLQKAQDHINLGHFALALDQLDALDALQRQQQKTWVDPVWLTHQRREIGLYADLLPHSLEELLAEATDLPEQEWQQQFAKRYLGKAVIFDTEVKHLADGRFVHDYQLHAGNQQGRLELANLPYFQTLPINQPRRVLFGARLKSIQRDEPGLWSVHFLPDSMVLLTDPQALAICCPELDNAETQALLATQKKSP